MKRTAISLHEVADRQNLAWAFWRSAAGKRHRPEVRAIAADLDAQLDLLQRQILDLTVPLGQFHRFRIFDPKPRTIDAPCFRERWLHHALMVHLAPVVERYLVADTFACRVGKGTHAAVRRAQAHIRRFPWYLKLDFRSYFHSVDRGTLKHLIRRRVKGRGVLALCDRIIDAYRSGPEKGKGLPIGALTSQHFANLYLAGLDRFILEDLQVSGMVRYMDDVVVWGHDPAGLRRVLEEVRAFAAERLGLELKPDWQLQRSRRGLTLCGFRIYAGKLYLSSRRRRRYRAARRRWEEAHAYGLIDDLSLQAGYDSALAITAGANAVRWRRQDLRRRPSIEV